MGSWRTERRLSHVASRLRSLRDELATVDEQLLHLADDADDLAIRAPVSETPGGVARVGIAAWRRPYRSCVPQRSAPPQPWVSLSAGSASPAESCMCACSAALGVRSSLHARHRIEIQQAPKVVMHSDVSFIVFSDEERLGDLSISKETIDWNPARRRQLISMSWERFARLMENTGASLRAWVRPRRVRPREVIRTLSWQGALVVDPIRRASARTVDTAIVVPGGVMLRPTRPRTPGPWR